MSVVSYIKKCHIVNGDQATRLNYGSFSPDDPWTVDGVGLIVGEVFKRTRPDTLEILTPLFSDKDFKNFPDTIEVSSLPNKTFVVMPLVTFTA